MCTTSTARPSHTPRRPLDRRALWDEVPHDVEPSDEDPLTTARMDLVAKAGLLVHAVTAGALVGSLTHLAVVVWRTAHGKARPRLLRLYPTLAACLWAAVFALGSLIYPNYRVAVRANYLDEHAPAVSILFDIKENLGTLMGPLLLAAWALTRADTPPAAGPRALPMVVYALAFIAWFDLLAGLLVTSVRAIG